MPIDNCLRGVWRLPLADTNAYGPYVEMRHHVGWNTLLADINDAADRWHEASDAFFDAAIGTSGLFSNVWDGNVQMRWYDLSDAAPVAHHMANLGPYTVDTGPNVLPPELAIVLTSWCNAYTGPNGPVTRRQSLQNRFYVGPLSDGWLASTGRPNPTALAILEGAYQDYIDVLIADTPDTFWPVVASETNGSAAREDGFWIDNDFDVQRRRGFLPTAYTGTRPS